MGARKLFAYLTSAAAQPVLLALVLLLATALRIRNVVGALPYCGQVDEETILGIARGVVGSGDPNPHNFHYPTFPIYLIAASLALGETAAGWLGSASAEGGWIVQHSYYAAPLPIAFPKLVFALLSVVALGALGLIAGRLGRQRAVVWLAPLLACAAATFFRYSWSYINVDTAGAAFALCTVVYVSTAAGRESAAESVGAGGRRPLVAGALAGLTIGCKYNLFPICAPCVLWLVLFERRRAPASIALLLGVAGLAFVLTSPFALLDFDTFFHDTRAEVLHYAVGKRAFDPFDRIQTFQTLVLNLAGNWGWLPLLASLAGVAGAARRNARLAAVVFSYPFALSTYMGIQHRYFERNLVSVHLFIALGLALGLLELPAALRTLLTRYRPERVDAAPVLAGVVALALLLELPWRDIVSAYGKDVEPRNAAAHWVRRHVKRDTSVTVDPGLRLDPRTLRGYRIVSAKRPKHPGDVAILSSDLTAEYRDTTAKGTILADFYPVAKLVRRPRATGDEPEPAVSVVRLGPGAAP